MDSAFITALSNAGIAGIFVLLFLFGIVYPKVVVTDLRDEIVALKQDLEAQRDRADAAVAAAQASRDVMAALQAGMQMARQPSQLEDRPGGTGS